eukprot:scaffold53730_cov41-Phaeocystis_antarctica.AAC.2
MAAAKHRPMGELGFHSRSIAQRRSLIKVRGCLHDFGYGSRPRLPSTALSVQRPSPHAIGYHIVRRRPHNARRQRLEPLVVPPPRLGHLGALLRLQHVEGLCRGMCPHLRAHRIALLSFKKPLRGLHFVPRVGEHCTEVEVRCGLVGPQGDGLAVGLACFPPVLLRAVPCALRQQLRVRVA